MKDVEHVVKVEDSKHNCNEYKKDSKDNYLYHYIYNQEGQCILDNEAPSYTYFHEFMINSELVIQVVEHLVIQKKERKILNKKTFI